MAMPRLYYDEKENDCMKKDYLKPDVEWISLVTKEAVTTDDDEIIGGELTDESSEF